MENTNLPPLNLQKFSNTAEDEELDEVTKAQLNPPPAFEPYHWPNFLMRCLECCEMDTQKDAMWIASLAILGATTAPLLRFLYSHKTYHPNLIVFLVASSAAGKGVITWPYKLGEPLQQAHRAESKRLLEEYKMKFNEWSAMGKQRGSVPEPERPPMRLFYISGNNTGTGILENLIDSKGIGCIFAPEADEISTAIASYIMTLLPKGDSEKHDLSPKQKFLNNLPIEFTRQEAVELATQYDLSLSTMDKLLGRMIKDGELIKSAHGCYQFCSEYNKK